MAVGNAFAGIFYFLMTILFLALAFVGLFLLFVFYIKFISQDPLPKVPKILLEFLSSSFVMALIVFALMMFVVIVYVTYQVFSLKEPIIFPKEEFRKKKITTI